MDGELKTLSEGWREFLAFGGFDYVCEVDQQARYLAVSPNYHTLLEIPEEKLLGHTPMELGLIHPEDLSQTLEALRPLFTANEQVRFEYRVRDSTSQWHWMESTGSAFQTKAGDWRALFISRDITERRAMEETRRRESFMLRDIVEFNPMSIQLLDKEGYTLSVNAAHTRLFQAVPPPDYSLFRDPLLQSQAMEPLLARMRAGEVVFFPEFYHNPHEIYDEFPDCPVWIRMVAFPIHGPDGTPERFVLMHEDITARRTAEKALEKESSFLRDLMEHNPMSIQILDIEGYTLHVNAAFIKLFGNPPPTNYSVFHDSLLGDQGLDQLVAEFRSGKVVYFPEFFYNPHLLYPDEKDMPAWIWMIGFPILDAEGRPERYVLMHSNVTERRLAEDALRASEAKFREFVEGTDDLVTQVNADGTVLYLNGAAARTYGLAPDACVGRPSIDFVHPDDRERTLAEYRRWIEDRRASATLENRCQSLSGEIHHLLWSVNLHFGEQGLTQFNAIGRDITQVKRTEEILRQTQKLESLGVLAGGIAHDFNNLLTALLGNLNLAQMMLSDESPAAPHLDAVEQTVLKASDLTRQMLAYSGKGRFVVKNHDLNQLIREMTHLLQVSISKKIALRLNLAPSLPPVQADGAQIQQGIMNLVTNASDAIGDREGSAVITTGVHELDDADITRIFASHQLPAGRYVTMEVSDTGSGIQPDVLERIFDPFFTTKTSGRGLGLSAMLGILRGHGGGCKIYSEPGRGTTFRIYLPTAQGEAATQGTGTQPPAKKLHGRILLVDDELAIRQSLQRALEVFGMEVVLAEDGQEALERFERDPQALRLVLMDLTMPRKDGRETFLAMRRIRPDIPVVLTSGYNEQDSIQELLGRGLAGFIQKPYQLKELRRILSEILEEG